MLDGNARAPFDLSLQYAREQQIFGSATPIYGWHYPPYFLFVAAALALMPYGLALAVWQAVTFGLYLLTIRAILSPSPRVRGESDRGLSRLRFEDSDTREPSAPDFAADRRLARGER